MTRGSDEQRDVTVSQPPEKAWHLPGADGMPVLGVCHEPAGGVRPRGTVLLIHGLMGYMDYGLFPVLAGALADAGFIAHRFNLSHSGMTRDVRRFFRPELFERDTWNRQRRDVRAVIAACRDGVLARAEGIGVFGHSRGGVTALRVAGCRDLNARPEFLPDAVFTAAAPSACCSMDERARAEMLERGYRELTSSRTGQTLRVGAGWLHEQLEDPGGHDLSVTCAQIRTDGIPARVMHGTEDATVPSRAARDLAEWLGIEPLLVPGGDHVFNTPNPAPQDGSRSVQLLRLIDEAVSFFGCLDRGRVSD